MGDACVFFHSDVSWDVGNCEVTKAQYGLWSGFVLEQGGVIRADDTSEFGGVRKRRGGRVGLSEKDERYLEVFG